jgi:hypothetical protein
MVFLICVELHASGVSFIDLANVSGFAQGNAITGAWAGLDASYKNPAGIMALKKINIKTGYASFYNNSFYAVDLGLGGPLTADINMVLDLPIKIIDGLKETVNDNNHARIVGQFQDLEMMPMVVFAKKVSQAFYMGLNAKYYYHRIHNNKATAWIFDFGCLFKAEHLNFGLAIQNIGEAKVKWSTGQNDIMKQRINLGISKHLANIVLLGDVEIEGKEENRYNIGADVKINEFFFLQLGLNDIANNKQLAMGLRIDLAGLSLNYGFGQMEDLGLTNKFLITTRF